MVRFIDEHKDRFGVEPIVDVLREASADGDAGFLSVSGYYAALRRQRSARAVRDEQLKDRIGQVHRDNYGVYGVRKMHAALTRDGLQVGRDQTARLMRDLGLQGVRRGKPKRTTIVDTTAQRAADLVQRRFAAAAPDRLWVCDLTYIRTWLGFAYLALVIDVYSRRIVGWSLAGHMRTELPLEALEHALWQRREREHRDLNGLVHHSDRSINGQPVHRHPLHRSTPRRRRQPLGRLGRRLLRQRLGRVHHRADQGRAHPPPRTLANPGTAGVRPVRVPRLVEPPPPPQRDRHDPACRVRGQLLPSEPGPDRGPSPVIRPLRNPGRFTCPSLPCVIHLVHIIRQD